MPIELNFISKKYTSSKCIKNIFVEPAPASRLYNKNICKGRHKNSYAVDTIKSQCIRKTRMLLEPPSPFSHLNPLHQIKNCFTRDEGLLLAMRYFAVGLVCRSTSPTWSFTSVRLFSVI